MQDLVVHKNKRPIIRPEWSKPPVSIKYVYINECNKLVFASKLYSFKCFI